MSAGEEQVIARFASRLPPETNVAVDRPFLPIFLRHDWENKRRSTLAESTCEVPGRQEQLWIHTNLKFRLLVIEKTSLHADEEVARTSPRSVAIIMSDCDRDLQLQLHVWQPVIQIEQRRVHFRSAWSALKNERDVNFPSARRRRFRIIRDKWRAGSGQIKCQPSGDANHYAANFR